MNLFDFFKFSFHAHNEIADNGADKVLSSGEENSSVHKTYVNFLTSRKRALDAPLYAISSGRSMVEMLGVLAIIGVLSVGAISGYSKAMMKYKLNKQREQITAVMSAMIEYQSIISTITTNESIVPTLIKLNALPPEMIINKNSTHLQDVLGLSISITRAGKSCVYYTFHMTDFADDNHTICRNILESLKKYSSVLYALGVNSTTAEDVNQQDWYFGDTSGYSQKIHMLNVNTMQNVCEKCDKYTCGIYAIVCNGQF